MSLRLGDPIRLVTGVGVRAQEGYGRLGIHRVIDLISHWPRQDAYLVSLGGEAITKAGDGDVVEFVATIVAWKKTPGRGKKSGSVILADATGHHWEATFFGQWPYWLARDYPVGALAKAKGRVKSFANRAYLQNLKLTPTTQGAIGADKDQAAHGGGQTALVPVYPATLGLDSPVIARHIQAALTQLGTLPEWLPAHILDTTGHMGYDQAVRTLHQPSSLDVLARAKARLVFDELFALQLVLQQNRQRAMGDTIGIVNDPIAGGVCDGFHASLPFPLTPGQATAIAQIDEDMASPSAMHRLLQGDVGTGKTLVAAHALLRGVDAGRQGVLMVPTQVLAEQHARTLTTLVEEVYHEVMGRFVRVGVLYGQDRKAERRQVLDDLKHGAIDILIATHAVLEPQVEFYDLGVVVIDEQHRFGVEHRRSLGAKRANGEHPDLLVMSATPIPRSIALTLYGDLSVSTITERPGQTHIKVTTLALPKDSPRREGLYDFIAQEVAQGRRAYVVCPLIEPSEGGTDDPPGQFDQGGVGDSPASAASPLAVSLDGIDPPGKAATQERQGGWADVAAATEVHVQLQERFAPTPVGLLHGRMNAEARAQVMDGFRDGSIPILVCTTVIEVGVSVDESSVMIIEDADRFGISQLHQLRGRLLRGYPTNYCVLFSSQDSQENPRLQALVQSCDGFELAEIDLQLRREGAIFGTNQTGGGELTLAGLLTDLDVVAQTRELAADLLAKDPLLAAYPEVRTHLAYRHIAQDVGLTDAG